MEILQYNISNNCMRGRGDLHECSRQQGGKNKKIAEA